MKQLVLSIILIPTWVTCAEFTIFEDIGQICGTDKRCRERNEGALEQFKKFEREKIKLSNPEDQKEKTSKGEPKKEEEDKFITEKPVDYRETIKLYDGKNLPVPPHEVSDEFHEYNNVNKRKKGTGNVRQVGDDFKNDKGESLNDRIIINSPTGNQSKPK